MHRLAWVGSAAHYIDHLAPIFTAMPSELRGPFVVTDVLEPHAASRGIDVVLGEHAPSTAELVVVASLVDLVQVSHHPTQRAVLVEHGAAQQYMGAGPEGDHGGWSGGPGRERVDLFVVPNQAAADANAVRYPDATMAVVGCAKLDRWLRDTVRVQPDPPVVAISFRWDCRLIPECGSAWPYYARHLRTLAEGPWKLLGHAHPRCGPEVWALYDAVGIETVRDFEEVMRRASVYVVDNSSTGFEFMVTDRPVVWLNTPAYRRDVHHGLRFWELADSGVQCNDPADLAAAITEALLDMPAQRRRRAHAVHEVYAGLDGLAAQRAASAILEAARA